MGIVTDTATSNKNNRSFEKKNILAPARLDAFVAISLTCLQYGGSDSVRDDRQKPHFDAFMTFLP